MTDSFDQKQIEAWMAKMSAVGCTDLAVREMFHLAASLQCDTIHPPMAFAVVGEQAIIDGKTHDEALNAMSDYHSKVLRIQARRLDLIRPWYSQT